MKSKMFALVGLMLLSLFASAGELDTAPPVRHITLEEAVELALRAQPPGSDRPVQG